MSPSPRDPQEGARTRILAIAAEHIRREGVNGLSVVRVARAAGMTHANVYRYFPSKAALAGEVATGWLQPVEQRLNDIVQSPDPADDKLERFLTLLARAYDEKARTDPEIFRVFAAAPPERHRQRVRELLGRIIEEGLSIRVFQSGDARRVTQLVLDATHRFVDPAAVLAGASGEPARAGSGEGRRDRLVRLLIRSLAGERD